MVWIFILLFVILIILVIVTQKNKPLVEKYSEGETFL